MNSSHWTDGLSEYLDGELELAERDACEAHLAGCAECARLLEELKAVVVGARALPPTPPPAELWNAIEAQLETPVLQMRPRAEIRDRLDRRWTLSLGQLATMAACLVAVTAAVMWLATRGGVAPRSSTSGGAVAVLPPSATPTPTPARAASPAGDANAAEPATPQPAATEEHAVTREPRLLAAREPGRERNAARGTNVANAAGASAEPVRNASIHDGGVPAVAADFGIGRYDAAIAELQSALDQRRSTLDSSTVRVVEQNLAIIDKAIADARTALATDPSSQYLNTYLASTMRRKVDFLRRVNSLARI